MPPRRRPPGRDCPRRPPALNYSPTPRAPTESGMNWLQALVLGVVEGLTEYLPVSSTAHLLLTQRALGVEQSAASDAYAVCIQSGAILAVLGIYARRVREMLLGLVGRDPAGLRLAVQIVVAF